MANVKISDLTDGSPIESGDLIEIERPGSPSVSRKAELGSAAGADIEDFATAAQGALADTAVQPSDLATVATTGDYDDLTNKPDLGDAAFLDVGTGAGDVAAGNHTHSNATTSVAGFMSASDKAKLDGIASGATANTGTVTSVGISVPTGLSASGGPITTSGTLTLTWSTGYQGYTTAEASKLAGIEAGAQVNTVTSVNSKTGAVSLTAADVGAAASSHTHSDATTGAAGFMSASDKSKLDGIQAGAQVNPGTATTSVAGLMSAADKSKLDGIQAGAQVNAVTSVAGKTGAVTLSKSDVGLGNADNTADSAKNVLSATKLTTARTIAGVSFDGTSNINIPYANLTGIPSTFAPSAHSHAISDVTNLQSSLDAKSPLTTVTVATFSANKTINANDLGKIHEMTGGSNVTVTLPNGLSAGAKLGFVQVGAGVITFAASGTLRSFEGRDKTTGPGAAVFAYFDGASTWTISGDLEA